MIELREFSLTDPEGRWLLRDLDWSVLKGGKWLLTGPSGAGKSRLLRVLGGVEQPRRGTVTVGGQRLWPGEGAMALLGRLRVGFAFASGGLLSNLSLRENLALPLRFLGLPPAQIQTRVEAALEQVGLGSVAALRPHALSGAARRHGNLARILALQPELILLDDPLEGLDSADRALTLALIQAWVADPGITLVLAQEEPGPFAEMIPEHLHLNAPIPSLETP